MRISDWSSDVCSSDLIERQVEDDTLSVRADQERVLEVLANLIDNAIRHSPEGGTVVLRATEHEDGVRIDVCDGGPGIVPQDRLRIFRSEEHTSELQSLMRISYAVFCLKTKKHK